MEKKEKQSLFFFSQDELYEAQFLWQITHEKIIKTKGGGRWIHLKSFDLDKSVILNIDTMEQKNYFVMHRDDNKKISVNKSFTDQT